MFYGKSIDREMKYLLRNPKLKIIWVDSKDLI